MTEQGKTGAAAETTANQVASEDKQAKQSSQDNQGKNTEQVQQQAVPEYDQRHTPEGGRHHQENLFTRVVNVDKKSYYLDVRENTRGKYLKLTESSQKRRSTILLSGHVVGILVQVLDDAIKENYAQEAPEVGDGWTTIFSRRVMSGQKKIYFDLMQNKYGRSINVAEVSQTRPKTAVIVSEHGWFQLKRALDDILHEFPSFQPAQPRGDAELITSKKISLPTKRFFFDLMQNSMGRFVKLSEVRKQRRETLFIPDVCFNVLTEWLDKLLKDEVDAEVDGLETLEKPESENEGHSTLARKMLKVEAEDASNNKTFNLDLRENSFGKFLRVTEQRPSRSSAVFLPSESFQEAKDILSEFANTQ